MKQVMRVELDDDLRKGLEVVESILDRSYNPYSGLCVGAALILNDGSVITGINYESASYGLTLCAERTAIARAQTEGHLDKVTSLVLSSMRRDSDMAERPLTPCGACRQWLAELAGRLGHDIPVFSFWKGSQAGWQGTALNLLPEAFQ